MTKLAAGAVALACLALIACKRTCLLVMSGMYFDDVGAWKELMEERLKRFSAYSPGS